MRASTLNCFVIVKNNEIVGRTIHDTEAEGTAHLAQWFDRMNPPEPTLPGVPPRAGIDRALADGYTVQHAIIRAHPSLKDLTTDTPPPDLFLADTPPPDLFLADTPPPYSDGMPIDKNKSPVKSKNLSRPPARKKPAKVKRPPARKKPAKVKRKR